MSVIETLLVFVGIPLLVVLLVFLAIFGRSTVRQPDRYRPGRPWPYPAAWYTAHPEAVSGFVARTTDGEADAAVAVGGATGEW